MAKKIAWSDQAKADVRTIDRQTAIDLLQKLARFLETEQGDVKRLQDRNPPEFRLRLGDYRVRYLSNSETITVLRVLHRREAYR